jgi:hypothetical protein
MKVLKKSKKSRICSKKNMIKKAKMEIIIGKQKSLEKWTAKN